MCRSGNAPRTAFATADPETYNRPSPPPPVSGARWFYLRSTHLKLAEARPAIKNGRRDAAGGKVLGGRVLGEKVLGEQPWANSLGRTALGGKVLMKSIQTDTSDPIPLRT